MKILKCAVFLFLSCLFANAQSLRQGYGYYATGNTYLAMLSGGQGYGAQSYSPAQITLTGYNPTGVNPNATYTSGATATGVVNQTCTLTFSTSGSPTVNAVGTVKLTGTNAIASGSAITFTTVGTGYGFAPTSAAVTGGTATCSGTAVVSSTLGAYTPMAVDAYGNISAGALLGYTVPALASGCLQSAGTTGPLSWGSCGSTGTVQDGSGTTTPGQLANSTSTAHVQSYLTPVNNALVVTNSSGVASESATLPSGLTIPGYATYAGTTPFTAVQTLDAGALSYGLSLLNYSNAVTTFATGFSGPRGLAFDASGNLYVSNLGTNTVSKVTTGGGVTTFATGFSSPYGLAFDASGNLYVTNYGTNTVSKVTTGGVVTTFATGFSGPLALAFDASGNLYVANNSTSTVSKVTTGGVVTTFATGLSNPQGLAFDASGNLYVANNNASTVSKVTTGGVVTTFATGFSLPVGLAFDASGNLYVANSGGNTVSKVTTGGTVTTFATGFSNPVALAFDASGNLYVANYGTSTVSEILNPSVLANLVTLSALSNGVTAQQNGVNPQSFYLYNTITGSNYERGVMDWVETANQFTIGTEKAGSGSNRAVALEMGGTTEVTLATNGNVGIGTASPTWKLSVGATNQWGVDSNGITHQTIGTAIASATTIAPITQVVHVTGTTTISTITAVANCTATANTACQITIIPDGLFSTTTGGNIAVATTAVVSKAIIFTYDQGTALWYPSY